MNMNMGKGEFSVYQFFKEDEGYECVAHYVDGESAVKLAKRLTQSVGAKIGITQRVIITDGGDCIGFEWINGKGVVFPTREDCENSTGH